VELKAYCQLIAKSRLIGLFARRGLVPEADKAAANGVMAVRESSASARSPPGPIARPLVTRQGF
jgi:hypothetical protein